MRRLFVFNMVSVDGYFAGPDGEIDWHTVDNQFNDYAIEQLKQVGTILFGRVTYDMMAGYWPTTKGTRDDPIVAGLMNSLPKVVFSKSLTHADWNNTRLVNGNIQDEVRNLKSQTGRDIAIFGSGTIVSLLAPTGLIDEYRLIVNPVVLGNGKSLFNGISRMNLKLVRIREFKNGNILLVYTQRRLQ